MDPFRLRRLGKTEVMLPQLGFGGAPLGNLFDVVSDADADATLAAAWSAGIRYYDTAPWYGRGLSEHRIGRALRERPPGEALVSTKIGRLFRTPADPVAFAARRPGLQWAAGLPFEHHYDYSYDGVMRSHEDSLQRLGRASVDMLVIHDLDLAHHGSEPQVVAHLAELITGGFLALTELKAAGRIRAIGCGVNDLGTIPRFAALFDLDFFLVALRYTLGEQETLVEEIPILEKRGIGMIIGGVFNSGLYAAGPKPGIRYNYREPSPEILEKAGRIEAICRRHDVPLAAAALQFPLHHPLVASVIPGALSASQVDASLALMQRDIPAALWTELKSEGLLREDAPTP